MASVEVEVSASAQRTLAFAVEFDEAMAVVRYRPSFVVSETDVVLTIQHERGHLCQVTWSEHWRRYLVATIRTKLVGQVLELLKAHHRRSIPDR
ncbi:hypothetical protein [Glycomyces xiaoerkulensis]|uniref:hypothetical protein n=1 Tax=Glycomyces xiaoerkulensis TaxID=2038139 RepID=UPI0012FFFE12|nr:hypothetical protein [Glycomyces xiaoerkulensis]